MRSIIKLSFLVRLLTGLVSISNMIVTCPKCGFQQPEDQYCAQCGVDMISFQPEPETLPTRLSKNLPLQIFLVVLIISGFFVSIYLSEKENIDQKIKEAFQADSTFAENIDSTNEDIVETAAVNTTASANVPASLLAASNKSNKPKTETAAVKIQKLEIAYAEVPMPLIQAWSAEGQILNETGQSRSILISNVTEFNKLRRQDWKPFFLPGGQDSEISTSLNIRDDQFQILSSTNSEVGVSFEIDPTEINPDQLSFELQIVISLPMGLDASIGTTSLSGRYTIPKNSALIVLGVLPKHSMSTEFNQAFQGTPLAVLQSPEFQSGASEFALMIRPH